MNEAISALAASNTTETLHPVDVLAATVAPAEKKVGELTESEFKRVENFIFNDLLAVDQNAKTEVGWAESEITKIETEVKTEATAAEVKVETTESELQKIEAAALHTVTDVSEKIRNVFVDAEQFVVKEAKKIWHIAAGGGSTLRNPG